MEKDGWVNYFLWDDNYFSHLKDDIRSKRFILTSLMENGHVRAIELERGPLLIPHRTLMNWNIAVDEAMFLGGLDKGEFLREFEPDFFFDDQTGHIESAARHVPSGHVASGVRNGDS